jgi:hypothetical protein
MFLVSLLEFEMENKNPLANSPAGWWEALIWWAV